MTTVKSTYPQAEIGHLLTNLWSVSRCFDRQARCYADGYSAIQSGPDRLFMTSGGSLDPGFCDHFQGFQFGQAAL